MQDGWTLTTVSPARALVDLFFGTGSSSEVNLLQLCPFLQTGSARAAADAPVEFRLERGKAPLRTFSRSQLLPISLSVCFFWLFIIYACLFFCHTTCLTWRKKHTNTRSHINGFGIEVVFFSLRTIWSTFYEKQIYIFFPFKKPKAFEAPPADAQFAVTSSKIFHRPRFRSHDFATFWMSLVR